MSVLLAVAVLIAALVWLWTPDLSIPLLRSRYQAADDQMVWVAGTQLHVRDSGPRDAPAVIMIHGFGSSLQTWEPWARGLQSRYRVTRFDLPGSGLSPPDPTGDYSDARTIAVMLALMQQLHIDKAAVVGNSIGGRIAWTFAAQHPQQVSRLVLVSPDGFASPGFAYGQAPKVPAVLSLMRYALPKGMVRSNLAASYGDPRRLTEATLNRYYDLLRAPGSRPAMIARMKQTVLQNPEPMLRSIQAPVLLLWGRKDALIPFSNSADYLRDLPHATLVSFPDLGHTPQEEDPARSLPPLEAFLAQ